MINKTLFISLLFLCSCGHMDQKMVEDGIKDKLVQTISNYYCMPYDTVKLYFVFTDTSYVISANLQVIHFYDSRDTADNSQFWLDGVAAVNKTTGNTFLHCLNIKGKIINNKANNTRLHSKISKNNPSLPLYVDTFNRTKSCDSSDIFCERNKGLSLKLSAILNDLPLSVKSHLNRGIMDSIIKSFLFSNAFLNGKDQLPLADTSDLNAYITHMKVVQKYHFANSRRVYDNSSRLNTISSLGSFFDKIHQFQNRENAFIYNTYSDSNFLFGDSIFLVIINEDLDSRLNHQNFYSIFNYEPILYDVTIYSENT